jgi:hypothetical protein
MFMLCVVFSLVILAPASLFCLVHLSDLILLVSIAASLYHDCYGLNSFVITLSLHCFLIISLMFYILIDCSLVLKLVSST